MGIIVKHKNVHNKELFRLVDEDVHSAINLLDAISDVDEVRDLIESLLFDKAPAYNLEQVNVIADRRNNNFSDIKKGEIHIDVFYKHINCFNVTELNYTIQR